MLDAELEARPVGQRAAARGVGGFGRLGCDVPAACLQQGLAQALELLVLGMQVAQVVAGRLGRGQRLEHDLRIAQGRLLVEVLADLRGIQAAAACMAGILEGGEAELDLGAGERVRRGGRPAPAAAARRRCRQSPVVGLARFPPWRGGPWP